LEKPPVPAWLDRLLGRTDGADPEGLLALKREARELRLQLEERSRQLAALQKERERQQTAEETHAAEAVQAKVERLVAEAAGPVTQLLTQAHLLEAEGKPVQARDVLAVARRLVRVLEEEGLTLDGRPGERAAFDPNRHAPLAGAAPAPGTAVVVRFAGVGYRGRVLRKAGVEREQG
jgi:molecular chaperone GrpE (heat shock protein)